MSTTYVVSLVPDQNLVTVFDSVYEITELGERGILLKVVDV